jgi:hypothetical protein
VQVLLALPGKARPSCLVAAIAVASLDPFDDTANITIGRCSGMLVSFSTVPQQVDFADGATYENGSFLMGWKGVLFQYGARAGAESITRIADLLEHQTLPDLCRLLHGIFVLFVFDKKKKTWHVTVDNSGLYHAFHDDATVGTSFLQMLALRAHSGRSRLAPAAVADFLAHGGIYWSRTLVEEISKIRYDEIIELRPPDVSMGDSKRIVYKDLPPRGSIDEGAFLDHYGHLAVALERERVSVDLTGGFDSRLTACLLNAYGVDFETAVVGRPSLPDVTIAAQAASLLGKALYVTYHDAAGIEHELTDLFREVDGLADVLDYHRSRQLSAERRRRGVTVVVTGAGGELYKDFWWLQDLPFYNSKAVKFHRLYDLRIRPISLPANYLTGEVAAAYTDLRERTIDSFGRLRAATNTESYDNVYYFYKMSEFSGRFSTSNINNNVGVVSPFLDYDNFLFGASLARSRRFANRFHRQMLTQRCPQLADLITTEGVTASLGKGSVFSDLLGYTVNRSQRLLKKIGERALRRRWMRLSDPNSPDMVTRVRQTPPFQSAVRDLKDAGIISADLPIHAIRDVDVGRILTLSMLITHLGR